eukprot:SAG31_NODE_11360_length_1039_cov_1.084043_1_plen_217_part_10
MDLAVDSAAAWVIAMSDVFTWMSQPFCKELPASILGHLAADPTTPLASRVRLHMRHSLLPDMQRVQELLDAHGALVETPSVAWMEEQFPHGKWNQNHTRFYHDWWYGRKRAWEALIAEWQSGNLSVISPPGALLPLRALVAMNEWTILRGQELQRELIGCEFVHAIRDRVYSSKLKICAAAALARSMTAQAEIPVEAYTYSARANEVKETEEGNTT